MDTDKLIKVILGALSAAGIGVSGYQTNAVTVVKEQADRQVESLEAQLGHWRAEVDAVRARAEAREIRDSDTCIKLIEAAREEG